MPRDDDEFYRTTTSHLKSTLNNQLLSHNELSQRAIDIVKINLLVTGILITGFSLPQFKVNNLLIPAAVLAFLYSTWCCLHVYRPYRVPRGLHPGAANEVEDMVSHTDYSTFNRKLMRAYRIAVEDFHDTYVREKESFRNALWSSYAAMLFIIFGFVGSILAHPIGWDIPILILVPIIALWGRDLTEDTE